MIRGLKAFFGILSILTPLHLGKYVLFHLFEGLCKNTQDMEEANLYRKAVDEGRTFSFQEEIVPFVDDVQARAEEWRSDVQTLLAKRALGVLHPDQVEHTYENIYVLATDSFQPHIQEQRYQERLQAVAYILNIVIEETEEER